MSLTLSAQESAATNLFYLERAPKVKTENPPLLILLHGIGSNEADLFSFADQLPDNFLVVSVRAPYTLGQGSYAWYQMEFNGGTHKITAEQEMKSRMLLLKFLDELKLKLKFDSQKIYLCGFSQGAIMSYSLGLTHPERIHAIAVMSGRLLDEIKPQIAAKEKLKSLKIFISHGTEDPTLNIAYARSAMKYLTDLGLHPSYKEYPERHTIAAAMLADLISWLKQNQ